ncbi:integrase_H2C2 domain-containing protein [Trichonephila clavata]|uniref:Integrase_H2C2 domain-containing protein n=1 Tax=Trichonephila clavata TaxID=2740835 RepID=A0A8X6LTN5_TRICU|nr:integrase_H2C2 domain-containing protein [Trichonephila clavata]
MNLNQNINTWYFLPHHTVVSEQKDSTNVRIDFDASSKGKGALSLNDCLESGPNLNPDLLKIILRFRLHKIAFCADIQRAFLEIEIVEEDRQLLKFLCIMKGGPNLDLRTHNVETFHYTRVTFGVKCSSFLLAAVIKLHLEKYVSTKAYEMLIELYVDDLINSTFDITEALQLIEDMIHKLSEGWGVNFVRMGYKFYYFTRGYESANMDCWETSEESDVPLKVHEIIWDNVNDNLNIDIKELEKLNKLVKITKRVILSTCGMFFDPIGIMSPFNIRMKLLLQIMWVLGISWDKCVRRDIKATFLEWIKEIEILKQFKIPRQYCNEINLESKEHLFS